MLKNKNVQKLPLATRLQDYIFLSHDFFQDKLDLSETKICPCVKNVIVKKSEIKFQIQENVLRQQYEDSYCLVAQRNFKS